MSVLSMTVIELNSVQKATPPHCVIQVIEDDPRCRRKTPVESACDERSGYHRFCVRRLVLDHGSYPSIV